MPSEDMNEFLFERIPDSIRPILAKPILFTIPIRIENEPEITLRCEQGILDIRPAGDCLVIHITYTDPDDELPVALPLCQDWIDLIEAPVDKPYATLCLPWAEQLETPDASPRYLHFYALDHPHSMGGAGLEPIQEATPPHEFAQMIQVSQQALAALIADFEK